MARTSTYLNFERKTEEAFDFYKSVFGGEFREGGIRRFVDTPPSPNMPPIDPKDGNLVMHVELSITGGHLLMGTDAPESMGFKVIFGNNISLNLEPDSKEEADRLFKLLSTDGNVTMPIQDVFWGAYFGSCTDKFGVHWMVNFGNK